MKKARIKAIGLVMLVFISLCVTPIAGVIWTKAAVTEPSASSIVKGDEWLWTRDYPDTNWVNESYVPTDSWTKSATPIGYSKSWNGNIPVNTRNVYLRRLLTITDIALVEDISINIDVDDWAFLYVNGAMVRSFNEGNTVGGNSGDTWKSGDISIDTSFFKTGVNVICVNVVNNTENSSDLYFNMSMSVSVTGGNSETIPDGPAAPTGPAKAGLSSAFTPNRFVISPGKDYSEMRFTWYSPITFGSDAAIKIAPKPDMIDEETFPSTVRVIDAEIYVAAHTSGTYSNKVTVDGLELNTEYAYSYGDKEADSWSPVYFFKTQPRRAYNAIFIGDPQIGVTNTPAEGESFNQNMNKALETVSDASLILSAGDQINNYAEDQYTAFLNADIIKKLPIATTIGNHETDNSMFSSHYNVPNKSNLGQTAGGSDYYFSFGNTIYMVLNGNSDNVAEHKSLMQEALASFPEAQWRVVMIHHDIYGAGPQAALGDIPNSPARLRRTLSPVFDELDIDIVLNGHDHTYARSHIMKNQESMYESTVFDEDGAIIDPDGILYITASCSSIAKFYYLVGNPSYIAVKDATNAPQFTAVNVTENEYKLTTYRSDTMGIIDSISIKKTTVNGGDEEDEDQTNENYRDTLQKAYDAARAFVDGAEIGDNPGEYPQSAFVAIHKKFDIINAVLNNADATDEDYQEAIIELQAAMAIFKASLNKAGGNEQNTDGEKGNDTGDIPVTGQIVGYILLLSAGAAACFVLMLMAKRKILY